VFNIKWSAIVGGFAFGLSLLVGMISGGGFIIPLIKAVVFGILFFMLGSCAYWLISHFLSELLDTVPGGEPEEPGSRVDIAVNDHSMPEQLGDVGGDPDGVAGLEAFSGLIDPEEASGGGAALDQKGEDGYTKRGTYAESSGDSEGAPAPAIPQDSTDAVDSLPDLETMEAVFTSPVKDQGSAPSGSGGREDGPGAGGSAPGGRAKPAELDGDFQPKELAAAIQTILKRD
jgi:hypothetical protein